MSAETIPEVELLPALATALGRLDDSRMQAIVQEAAQRAGFRYLLWQTVTDAGLDDYPSGCQPTDYVEAQAFSPAGDLRWRRESWFDGAKYRQGWRVVYLGSPEACPAALQAAAQGNLLDGCQADVRSVRLWGEHQRQPDTWLEVRIPRRLDYPGPHRNRWLGLRIGRYLRAGRVEFIRLLDLAPWTGGI